MSMMLLGHLRTLLSRNLIPLTLTLTLLTAVSFIDAPIEATIYNQLALLALRERFSVIQSARANERARNTGFSGDLQRPA